MKQGLKLLVTLSFHRRGNPKRKKNKLCNSFNDWNLLSKRAPEHVMFNNVGSINDSRINVKKCASRNGLKLLSANTARSMRCNTAVKDRGRRLNQSHFRSMAEVSFLPSANTRKRTSASREHTLKIKINFSSSIYNNFSSWCTVKISYWVLVNRMLHLMYDHGSLINPVTNVTPSQFFIPTKNKSHCLIYVEMRREMRL